MGKFSEIDADLYAANDNYYGYVGKIGKPIIEEIYILSSYCEAKDRIENLFAYRNYEDALEAKREAEKLNKDNCMTEYELQYFVEVLTIKD